MHYLHFQSFPSLFSIPKLHLKYTKEILQITKENIGYGIFSVLFPLHYFHMSYMTYMEYMPAMVQRHISYDIMYIGQGLKNNKISGIFQ